MPRQTSTVAAQVVSDNPTIRSYSVVFTDGKASRRTAVEAISLAHARERSANIARGMMNAHAPGTHDWSAWRILIATPDEGGCDDPFPEPAAGGKPDGRGEAAPPKASIVSVTSRA